MPYNILLSVVRDLSLPDEFKACVTRLLNCLYLDAYPQNMVRLPTLTRIWGRINPNITPLPAVPEERDKHFAFLQEAITEHLENLVKGAKWTVFTRRQMESLMLLVKFRFYTSAEQIQEVVVPLLKTLDRRNAIVEIEDEGSKRNSMLSTGAKISPIPGGELVKPKIKWQIPMLKTLNGVPAMLSVLGLVFLAITVSVIQLVSETPETLENPEAAYEYFEYFTTVVFTFEVSERAERSATTY
tara:strand:+ start:138 stop:863 length:726 start_codon:yes stop_codon:yes gene_type:complete